MKLEKISLSEVQEEVQKQSASNLKRTHKDLTTKEREIFSAMYPLTTNEDLSKQFLISVRDVETLAHDLEVYKDPAFTQHQIVKKNEGSYLTMTAQDGSTATPGYLFTELTKKLSEEERREILSNFIENKDPVAMMRELAYVQETRLIRGIKVEAREENVYRAVNDVVDTLHQIYKTLHEMEFGQKTTHVLTIDDMILRAQNIEQRK